MKVIDIILLLGLSATLILLFLQNYSSQISSERDLLIDELIEEGFLKSEKIISVFRSVDRRCYCLDPKVAYENHPSSIGYGATISAAHMHAAALENLLKALFPGAKILDIGSGSGILLALIAPLIHEHGGKVYGVEHIKELVEQSLENLKRDGLQKWINKTIFVIETDGRNGYEKEAPYDGIHIGATALWSFFPKFFDQLKMGGILVSPFEFGQVHGQKFLTIQKIKKRQDKEPLVQGVHYKVLGSMGVRYIPLTSRDRQLGKAF